MTIYEFGRIILISFPYSDLRRVSKRPAAVLYDAGDKDVLVARITTRSCLTATDYKIDEWKQCGLNAASYIRLGKQATIEKQFVLKILGELLEHEKNFLKTIPREMFRL